jgi:DNA-binding MarR family transcriptional regulator
VSDSVVENRSHDGVVEAVIAASRALVAVAARSLAATADDITLPQFRVLVILATQGPQRVVDLAEALDVNTSTSTRMCDRLVRKGLVERTRPEWDRRTVVISLTRAGRDLVNAVMRRRRADVRAILRRMTPEQRSSLVSALRGFSEAAGEAPEQAWSLGWK